jgi:hypothetical protein
VCLIDWNHLTCACAIDDKEDWLLKKLSLLSSVARRDFGSIFSMLLPGTMAKLEPPEGGDSWMGLKFVLHLEEFGSSHFQSSVVARDPC